ncbi:MAG: metallophosphoesterase family protein [Coriobacteriia bacterium]
MIAPVRFIHAADLHLDAPFGGIDAEDRRVRDALVESTYRALDAIVSACIENQVDFLVIAGDVYNSRERGVRSQFAFARAAEALAEAGIPVYLVHGNHDPAGGGGTAVELPANVHAFAHDRVERAVVERDGQPLCAVYGRSFRTAAETANLARDYRREADDAIAIGILHANVGGRPGYDNYAPCSTADLMAARMDYWALGHIHKPETVLAGPLSIYAGCPQGLDPTQSGPRGCYLVTLGDGPASAEFIPTAAIIWDAATVDCADALTLDDVRSALLAACESARAAADGAPVAFRVELVGRSAAHRPLAAPGALAALVAEVRADAMDAEQWVWIDRIRDHTRPPIDLHALRATEDFSGDIVRMADEYLADPERAKALVRDELAALFERVGDAVLPPDAVGIITRARDLALDRLLAEGER